MHFWQTYIENGIEINTRYTEIMIEFFYVWTLASGHEFKENHFSVEATYEQAIGGNELIT